MAVATLPQVERAPCRRTMGRGPSPTRWSRRSP